MMNESTSPEARGHRRAQPSRSTGQPAGRKPVPRWFPIFMTLFGAICSLIALAHILLGTRAIPGVPPMPATIDSEDRFYASLFFGFGLAVIWCAREIRERHRELLALMAVFALGGLARILSMLMVGLPHPLFIGLTAVELLLPLAVWIVLSRTVGRTS